MLNERLSWILWVRPSNSASCLFLLQQRRKRPNFVRPLGELKSRDALNEAHVPFDFFFVPFFFLVAITLLLGF